MSEDKHEFEPCAAEPETCSYLSKMRLCGLPRSAAIHRVVEPQDENQVIPASALYWLKHAKDESNAMAERLFYMENAYNHVVNALHADVARGASNNTQLARRAAEKVVPARLFLGCRIYDCDRCHKQREAELERVTAIILETFGGEGQQLSPLAKEQRPVSRLADSIVGAMFRCIHEMESELTDGRRDPAWWLDTLKAKSAVIKLLERHFASSAPQQRPAVCCPHDDSDHVLRYCTIPDCGCRELMVTAHHTAPCDHSMGRLPDGRCEVCEELPQQQPAVCGKCGHARAGRKNGDVCFYPWQWDGPSPCGCKCEFPQED